jgi:hypothetical protein
LFVFYVYYIDMKYDNAERQRNDDETLVRASRFVLLGAAPGIVGIVVSYVLSARALKMSDWLCRVDHPVDAIQRYERAVRTANLAEKLSWAGMALGGIVGGVVGYGSARPTSKIVDDAKRHDGRIAASNPLERDR